MKTFHPRVEPRRIIDPMNTRPAGAGSTPALRTPVGRISRCRDFDCATDVSLVPEVVDFEGAGAVAAWGLAFMLVAGQDLAAD